MTDNQTTGQASTTDEDNSGRDVLGTPFTAKGGETVYIDASDPWDVRVRNADEDEIGRFQFREIEYPSGQCGTETCLHLCHMEIDAEYRRRGIGRACIRQARLESGAASITASNAQARNLDDGSHLIGDGPGFVRALAREGVLHQEGDEAPETDDD